jgi:metal-responsive CopG/Arc/MetJ family transcriptional regulator
MTANLQKFASQAPSELLDEVRKIAREDGRQPQAVIEDALRAYVDERRGQRPRAGGARPSAVIRRSAP